MVTETVVISWRAHKCFIGTPYLFKNNSSYFPFGAYEIHNHRLLYLFNETFSQGMSILVCFSIAVRKHSHQKQLEEEKFLWLTLVRYDPSLRKAKAESQSK